MSLFSRWRGVSVASPAVGALTHVAAEDAKRWLGEGDTLLVDIREMEEIARMPVPGATAMPLSRFPERIDVAPGARRVVFLCQSGNRTRMAAGRLAASTDLPAFALAGGASGWR